MEEFSPVFLIGPGRSGSTLLYKVLSLHPAVGYISNYDAKLFPSAPTPLLSRATKRWTGLKTRVWFARGGSAYLFDRPFFQKIVPSPVEGEPVYGKSGVDSLDYTDSFSQDTRAKLRRVFSRLQGLQGTKVLLLKRLANNRRLSALHETFPESKFIYLIRDGRAVAFSLPRVNWWDTHRVWWKGGLTALELEQQGEDGLAIAARTWVESLRSIDIGLNMIDRDKVLIVRYEQLLENPVDTCRSILSFIGLDCPMNFERTVESLNLKPRSEAWEKEWTTEQYSTVVRIQKNDLEKLGYLKTA